MTSKRSTVEVLAEKGLQVYVAYHVRAGSAYKTPIKSFFTASNATEAIEKLYKGANVKDIDGFKSVVLMEMLPNNEFREVMVKDSTVTTETLKNNGDAETASNVIRISDYKKDKVGKAKGKPHVKLSWLTTKIASTDEKRILDNMKYITDEGFVPKEVEEYRPTGWAGMPNRSQADQDAIDEYYGYGPYGYGD